jgi:hypothetical protein
MEIGFYYLNWFFLVLECVFDAVIIPISVYQLVWIYWKKPEIAGSKLFVFGQLLRCVVALLASIYLINALRYETLPFWLIFVAAIILFLAGTFIRRYRP